MANVPYSITPGAIMVVLDNQPKVVSSTHMNYERLKDALRAATHDVGLISDLEVRHSRYSRQRGTERYRRSLAW